MGYHVHYHGQKTHYGVALLSKHPFKRHFKGFPNDGEESQRRFIGGVFESPLGGEITVLNGYFPQGENRDHPIKFPAKEKYYADLLKRSEEHTSELQSRGHLVCRLLLENKNEQ